MTTIDAPPATWPLPTTFTPRPYQLVGLPALVDLTCAECGAGFKRLRSHYLRRPDQPQYCGRSCAATAHNKATQPRYAWTDVTCHTCGATFAKRDCEIRKNTTGKHYCALTCYLADAGEGKAYRKTNGRHTHRVVAEEVLGRPLLPGEIVHHIDEDKTNNSPWNLDVFPSKAEHTRYHSLKYWASKR